MTIEQYSTKFIELSKFAPNLIPNEETKAERFLDGLLLRIREKISFLEIKECTMMVNMTMIADRGIKEVTADYTERKRSML